MQNDNVVPLVKAKESTKSERDKELEAMGFVLDGDKVADLKPLCLLSTCCQKSEFSTLRESASTSTMELNG
jgi:hypothetical protein